MKRPLALVIAMLLGSTPALASQVNLPYTFVAGTPIVSAQVNSDLQALVNVVNGNIDSTNISIARGIGANYVVASGNGATGSFQAGSYTFTAPSAGGVPLTIQLAAGQTADAVDVMSSSASKLAYISAAGVGSFSNMLDAGVSASQPCVGTDPNKQFINGNCNYTGTSPIQVSGMAVQCPTCVTSVSGGTNTTSTGGTTPSISMVSAPSFSSVNVTGLTASAGVVCTDASKNLSTSGCSANTTYDQSGNVVGGLIHLHGSAPCTILSTTSVCDQAYTLTGIPGLPAAPEGGCSAGRFDTAVNWAHKEVVQALIVNQSGSPQIDLNDAYLDGTSIGTAGNTITMYFDCWVK